MAAVVALGEDHRIHFGWFNAQDDRWNEPVWAALDGPVVHGPIVQEVGSEAFVFGVDAAGRVLSAHLPNPGHAPGGWTELEGACVGRPATTSWDVNRLDLFARDGRGVLRQTWLEHRGAGWEPKLRWVDVAEGLVEPPAAVSWGPERLDLFTRTASGELVHKWWDDAADRLDAFTIRDSTPLSHKYWDPGTGWLPAPLSEWEHLGGSLTIPPTVVTWGKYHLDVFSRGTDGHLHHIWWNPESGWSPQAAWEDMRGVLGDSLAAVAWSRDRLGVFWGSSAARWMAPCSTSTEIRASTGGPPSPAGTSPGFLGARRWTHRSALPPSGERSSSSSVGPTIGSTLPRPVPERPAPRRTPGPLRVPSTAGPPQQRLRGTARHAQDIRGRTVIGAALLAKAGGWEHRRVVAPSHACPDGVPGSCASYGCLCRFSKAREPSHGCLCRFQHDKSILKRPRARGLRQTRH
ncbi:MAG: hypothetical protein ACRDSL_20565 [Pseudonocardiaceae bacterium]